ncbi:hypothetical protein H5410_057718 [Solanum commersonii]|uniref:BED-type domain-containing protein n=1 Tax=Solanum commersonii TaxID=4109 RepID=A0A9J5WRE7_SOLCO|nr:hypothetical protein H5410_057718 [Solanum commersonii]
MVKDNSEASNKRKVIETTIACCKHFEKLIDEDGATKTKCNYCGKTYATTIKDNGTLIMNNHLTIKKCPKFSHTVDDGQTLIDIVPSSMGAKEGVVSIWKFEQAQSRRTLVQMVIIDELLFSFIEKKGFKNFMKVTVSQFHIPSCRTLTRDC